MTIYQKDFLLTRIEDLRCELRHVQLEKSKCAVTSSEYHQATSIIKKLKRTIRNLEKMYFEEE